MNKMIIEARINEYAMRDGNPHVPWTADEIAEAAVRCREAGASILHYHARKVDGSPDNSVKANAEIIRKIREKCDILIHPTLGFISNDDDPNSRIDTMLRLAEDPATKPDLAPIDTGSMNLELYYPSEKRFEFDERIYTNSTTTLQHYARELRRVGIKPQIVCWNIGFLRRADIFVEMGLIDEPTYMLFILTNGQYVTGPPGTPAGVEAFHSLMPAGRRSEWSTACMGGNLIKLAPIVAQKGGHLAIGIGDYPYKELGQPTNEDLIRMAVEIARANGREIASPQDTREMIGLS
jgi:3-keto-5-aminohexanoate cleavage enzyme